MLGVISIASGLITLHTLRICVSISDEIEYRCWNSEESEVAQTARSPVTLSISRGVDHEYIAKWLMFRYLDQKHQKTSIIYTNLHMNKSEALEWEQRHQLTVCDFLLSISNFPVYLICLPAYPLSQATCYCSEYAWLCTKTLNFCELWWDSQSVCKQPGPTRYNSLHLHILVPLTQIMHGRFFFSWRDRITYSFGKMTS